MPRAPEDKPQESYVAINPRDSDNVVVSYIQALGQGSDHHNGVSVDAHIAWTADGGTTWTVAPGTTHKGYRRSLDAAVTFDMHGHAFLAYIGLDQIRSGTRHGEFVLRSSDGGRTWSPPISLIEHPETSQSATFEHMPDIVADTRAASPYAGNLYVTWDRILADGMSSEMMFVKSTDDGRTWSAPKTLSKHPTRLFRSTAIDGDGTLYLLSTIYWPGACELTLSISRDGGETFGAPLPVVRTQESKRSWPAVANFPRSGGAPVIAIDPRGSTGKLVVTWSDFRNEDMDILATASDDGGHSWTAPVRVNDDPIRNGKDQVMPQLAVDPTDGAVYVLFYDRRNDPHNKVATVTLARSTDAGRSFTNYAWSDRTSDPTQAGLGDFIGLAAMDGRVYGAWTENLPMSQPRAPLDPGLFDPSMPAGYYDNFPTGPSAMRIGMADFRKAAIRK